MHKILRILTALLAALMLALTALPAFADVIIEPNGSFYDKHADECRHVTSHTYIARDEAGLNLYDEPDGKLKETMTYGETMIAQWQYTAKNGDVWFCIVRWQDDDVWFRLSDVLRLYDHNDYFAEHQTDFFDDTEEYRDVSNVVFYEYPNGPIKYSSELGEEGIHFGQCIKDENGKTWGYIGYLYGSREAWVCLDDPENAELGDETTPLIDPMTGKTVGTFPPGGETDEPEATVAADDGKGTVGKREDINTDPVEINDIGRDEANGKNGKTWWIVGIVAAAAAACAAVLAAVLKKPGKKAK